MPKLIDEATLQERFAEHRVLARDYVDSVNAAYGLGIYVNDAALLLAIKSAYDDVERYKMYHQEEPERQKSNSVKRVAYLTKWLMKTRPLHWQEGDITDVRPLLVNAGFCLTVARGHIGGELSQSFEFSMKKEYEMTYDLTYRELNGDALLSMYQNFFDLVQGESLIEGLAHQNFQQPPA